MKLELAELQWLWNLVQHEIEWTDTDPIHLKIYKKHLQTLATKLEKEIKSKRDKED